MSRGGKEARCGAASQQRCVLGTDAGAHPQRLAFRLNSFQVADAEVVAEAVSAPGLSSGHVRARAMCKGFGGLV